ASKYQRPREVARRPYGAVAAGSCSTYRFPPWKRISTDIQENVQPLPDDFSSFLLNSFRKNAKRGQSVGVARTNSLVRDNSHCWLTNRTNAAAAISTASRIPATNETTRCRLALTLFDPALFCAAPMPNQNRRLPIDDTDLPPFCGDSLFIGR